MRRAYLVLSSRGIGLFRIDAPHHPGHGRAGHLRLTAALLRRRTGTRATAPVRPDQSPPAGTGMIPLTVPGLGRLLACPPPPGAAAHWLGWRRRHQARAGWYHQRTRHAAPTRHGPASAGPRLDKGTPAGALAGQRGQAGKPARRAASLQAPAPCQVPPPSRRRASATRRGQSATRRNDATPSS